MNVSLKDLTNNTHGTVTWARNTLRKFVISKKSNTVYSFLIDATYSTPDNKPKTKVMMRKTL